jgi:GTP diphosphokinase / guanosine-3',5'-bis(diphosphate) 3'-diphosphatase
MKRKLLARMLAYATHAHRDQFDRSGMPYILHPITVMTYLNTLDEELQCIALGHDLLEDCDVSQGGLIELFTPRIVDGIWALTKFPADTLETYKAKVKRNSDAIRVKLCDLQHNMDVTRLYKMNDRDVQRMAEYAQFYRELLECQVPSK